LTLDDTAAPQIGAEGNTYFVRNGEVQRQKPVFAAGATVPTQWSLDASVAHSGFGKVAAMAGAGNDLIRLETTNAGPITTVHAGAGHDIVVGGAADDIVHGDGGNDILIGGTGTDTLWGGEDEDILIGGSLTNTTTAAVRNLRADWIAPTPFWTRVAAMRARLTAGVVEDTAADNLYGEGGLDWFWGVWVGSPMEVKDFQVVSSTVEAVR
jgi:Ca2+-binding RTX toxin-like protein